MIPWSAEQKDAFVRMQFEVQRRSYDMQSPEAGYDIILHDETPIGRLIVDRAGDLFYSWILPCCRTTAIGGSVLL